MVNDRSEWVSPTNTGMAMASVAESVGRMEALVGVDILAASGVIMVLPGDTVSQLDLFRIRSTPVAFKKRTLLILWLTYGIY